MKEGADRSAQRKKVTAILERNKYVFLVILAGCLLLALPSLPWGGQEEEPMPEEQSAGEELDSTSMEKKLSGALSQIDGAGEVTVVLSVKGGVRQILAQDNRQTEGERTADTVVVSKGSGREEPVQLQQLSPEYRGALVICPGGDDPAVRLEITQAVGALTGLGADKITVCKGK